MKFKWGGVKKGNIAMWSLEHLKGTNGHVRMNILKSYQSLIHGAPMFRTLIPTSSFLEPKGYLINLNAYLDFRLLTSKGEGLMTKLKMLQN
jgi:hypothetical protein